MVRHGEDSTTMFQNFHNVVISLAPMSEKQKLLQNQTQKLSF